MPAFIALLGWVDAFICQPHPRLGREGAVCPYVSTSIEKGLFWLTAQGTGTSGWRTWSAWRAYYHADTAAIDETSVHGEDGRWCYQDPHLRAEWPLRSRAPS